MGKTNKPDPYDFCFGCEHLHQKRFGWWNEYVCTFNGNDDRTVIDRLIERLDKCPKTKDGEQE